MERNGTEPAPSGRGQGEGERAMVLGRSVWRTFALTLPSPSGRGFRQFPGKTPEYTLYDPPSRFVPFVSLVVYNIPKGAVP